MSLEQSLKHNIEGDVHFDAIHKHIYSVDASIFEIEPVGIVVPKHRQDLICAIKIAHEHKIPIIPRGAATGITGGCIGKGLVIDTSKYLNHIKELNFTDEYVVCEPGVVQDRLNEQLYSWGYRLGPDTSTGNRATLGGMVANNSAGAHSLKYGVMAEHILETELILATGEIVRFKSTSNNEIADIASTHTLEGKIYRDILKIQKEYRKDIENNFPKLPRRVSGYNLDALLDRDNLNICKLIAGSEGTLGLLSEVKLKICKRSNATGLCVIHFQNMIQAMQQIETILAFQPIAVEMIDEKILKAASTSPDIKHKLNWLVGNPQAVFVVEFEDEHPFTLSEKLIHFSNKMKENGIGYAYVNMLDPKHMNQVWDVRKSGLGLLLSKRSYSRAIAFLEDITVPPQQLAAFMERFCSYLQSKGKEAGIYGHVGSGCMHIRPYIDLRQESELKLMQQMMIEIADLLLDYGGALSGEHGDGFIRSWLNEKMFGPRLYKAFCDLKIAFDPENLMNPGKIVRGSPPTKNLRLDPNLKKTTIPTFLDFSREGGFELAVDLCNGNGLCRKSEKTMCPSFQATGDEYDTTRARAQALRAVINGKLPLKELSGQQIYDVLDLCLECKGCKTECPSEVDMAKLKAEFLHHYHQAHGVSWRSKLFANIGLINQWNAPFASIFNFLCKTHFAKTLQKQFGITSKRQLPQLTKQRFSSWFKKHKSAESATENAVVLMNDTFMEFNHPEMGIAAVKILEALGYQVLLAPWSCCGRPAFSKGLLEQAKDQAQALIKTLLPYAQANIPIIGMEPSCLLTVKDDYLSLLGYNQEDIHLVKALCTTFDEFVFKHIENRWLPIKFNDAECKVAVHGHCHQKALVGTGYTLEVLRAIPGCNVSEIPSGCCGMAGSFGYEEEHYDISMRIGNLKLFPAIEDMGEKTEIVADGFSCRCQIAHGTQRKALHLAEFLAKRLA